MSLPNILYGAAQPVNDAESLAMSAAVSSAASWKVSFADDGCLT
jgi:hypothetical protein